MTGGIATFVRAYESVAADTPPADRWDALGEAIEQHGRDIDAFAERARAERIEWRERLESFNRATHSDLLREMQIAPAEELRADDEQPVITIRFGLALALLTAVMIGAHIAWFSQRAA